jgi:hypothetical protein
MTLYEDFLRLYHEQDLKKMSFGILKLLYEQMNDLKDEQQFKDMEHFMGRVEDIAKDGKVELPGMMYGMIWDCWRQLIELKTKRLMNLADFKWEPETPRPLNFTEEPRSMDPYRFEED